MQGGPTSLPPSDALGVPGRPGSPARYEGDDTPRKAGRGDGKWWPVTTVARRGALAAFSARRGRSAGQKPQAVVILSVKASSSNSEERSRPNRLSHLSCAAYASRSRAPGHSYFICALFCRWCTISCTRTDRSAGVFTCPGVRQEDRLGADRHTRQQLRGDGSHQCCRRVTSAHRAVAPA